MNAITLLDHALGTELSRTGVDTSGPLWSARALVEAPEAVERVHAEALAAGAQILTTATFRTHERTLERAGWGGRSGDLARRAVEIARKAIAACGREDARVAGSIGPLEDCFRADLVPDDAALAVEHARQAGTVADAGADLLLVETMGTHREAVAATRAAVATRRPTWCSFVTSAAGRLLSGEPLGDAVRAVEDEGAEAVLVNCVPAIEARREMDALAAAARVPAGIYPNVGHARGVEGWRRELMLEPAEFAAILVSCRDAGASVLGGCCGTEARHLAALAREAGSRITP